MTRTTVETRDLRYYEAQLQMLRGARVGLIEQCVRNHGFRHAADISMNTLKSSSSVVWHRRHGISGGMFRTI